MNIHRRWEQYLGERGIKSSKQIDFADYKNKIADATFVDDLEINNFPRFITHIHPPFTVYEMGTVSEKQK